jgi:hypothetical protein
MHGFWSIWCFSIIRCSWNGRSTKLVKLVSNNHISSISWMKCTYVGSKYMQFMTANTCLSVSCSMSNPNTFRSQSQSKTTGFGTYDRITSQTVPSSNYLGSYCCRRTHYTLDTYSNSFRIAEHRFSTYPRGSDSLSRSAHRSVSGTQKMKFK